MIFDSETWTMIDHGAGSESEGSCQLVADLLVTRQTILTCQDIANKLLKWNLGNDTTDTTDFCLHSKLA